MSIRKKIGKRHKQRGFTFTEVLTSVAIFSTVMGLGSQFFMRTQATVKLAEHEAYLQMHSRQAMTQVTKDLRQASDYFEVPFPGVPQAKEIKFVRPVDDQQKGLIKKYILVRYWFEEDQKGVFSMLRAEKDHGDQPHFSTADADFAPNSQNSADVAAYKVRAILKEATVIEPGKQSYFYQHPENPELIDIRMVTAVYGFKRQSDGSGKTQEVKRQFRIDTSVNVRNLN